MTLFLSGTIADEFKVWPLEAATMTVGRSSRNDIQIADATVSSTCRTSSSERSEAAESLVVMLPPEPSGY